MNNSNILAVIGTAGRQEDINFLDKKLYDKMYSNLISTMEEWNILSLVSGGAAWGDHLAIRAFLEKKSKHLILCLPAPFEKGHFIARGDGSIVNRYHDIFTHKCKIDSRQEITLAIQNGAEVHIGVGFIDRNLEVSRLASHMIAFTFGGGETICDCYPTDEGFSVSRKAGLKDGGTSHTWRSAYKCYIKRHIPLHWLRKQEEVFFIPKS
jgi:hypothetical protein